MPAIVQFPTVVTEALAEFGHLFANEPERVHFAEYLTGLMLADRKNVSAISRGVAVTTDPSCLRHAAFLSAATKHLPPPERCAQIAHILHRKILNR